MIWFWKKKEAVQEEPQQQQEEAVVVQVETQENPVQAVTPVVAPAPVKALGWFEKLKISLRLSSSKIAQGITDIFTKKKLDDDTLQQLEELLITADLGPATSAKLVKEIARNRFGKEVTPDEIKEALAEEIEKILVAAEKPLFGVEAKPFVMLMVGVNGTGKTTTIGKWAHQFKDEGKKVLLAAGDTFRAAAVEQLTAWANRIGCPIVSKDEGADAAALAYEAIERAEAEQSDILLIDTAGRLQNKSNLMSELQKVVRVIKKKMPEAPHSTILVLDATVGQNAHSQVDLFRQIIDISGVVVTKLDGTAKGGVLVGLVERFGLPVYAIGIGEGIEDLRPFVARDYARTIVGLEDIA